jgi:hypothetical protein
VLKPRPFIEIPSLAALFTQFIIFKGVHELLRKFTPQRHRVLSGPAHDALNSVGACFEVSV